MAKSSKQKSYGKMSGKGKAGGAYKDRNLAGMSPEKCQEMCKPTEANPIPMQKQMAGC